VRCLGRIDHNRHETSSEDDWMGGKLMNKRIALGVAAAILMGGVGACYPGSISDIGEADLVVTVYDTAFNFSPTQQTFFMPDSIIRVGEGDDSDVDGSYDGDILRKVADELAALGYERLEETSGEAPDLFVVLGTSTSTFGWWVPGGCYWCWYPGYPGWGPGWGPGYGGWYPWYPGYGGTYSTGSLGILMLESVSTGQQIPAVWSGVINGLLSSTTANTAARVLNLIEQVFDQSPELSGATNLPAPN
jgi:hypothetical protein